MEIPLDVRCSLNRKGRRGTGANRRQAPRLSPEKVTSLISVSTEMRVVNISRGGALLETEARLVPGTRIVLKVVTVEGAIRIAGQVLRSSVSSLIGNPKYQSAVAFETPLGILDDISEQTLSELQPSLIDS